jgi:hypothetical protein
VESIERHCEETQRSLETALKSTQRLASGLKRAQKAASQGDLSALHKSLAEVQATLTVARTEVGNATASWHPSETDEAVFFSDGGFQSELMAAAEAIGLQMSAEDGLLVSYPSLIKLDANRRCVIIDRKPWRAVRPSVLAAHLQAVQSRPPKFKPAQFLESLYDAWEYARARHLLVHGRAPIDVVHVRDIYAALTIAPGSAREYSKPEFGRDLYLLESRVDVRQTRKGARVRFARSTGTKSAGFITVVREDGRRVDYSGVGFEV